MSEELREKIQREGGPAFPVNTRGAIEPSPGMSLRDYAAIKIAAALAIGCSGMLDREFSAYAKGPCNAAIANRAYALADTLLRERAK